MELEFTFRNIESTEAIRAWALKRFAKVEKHLREPSAAHVTLTVSQHRHRADLTVHAMGDVLHASDETDDMYATLDNVMVKLEHAAQKQKDYHAQKLKDRSTWKGGER